MISAYPAALFLQRTPAVKNKILITTALMFAGLSVSAALAGPIGPSNYTSQADSPFAPASFDYFFLEDVEDNLINTAGLTATGSGLCIAGFNCFVGSGLTDSVGNGGNGQLGRSIFAAGSPGITLTFDAGVLGSLPTAVGLVWTDGAGSIQFQAYDQNNVLLGTINGEHADASFFGTLGDDRFYGWTNTTGISRVVISNTAGGIEIDHVQYGGMRQASVPEPSSVMLILLGLAMIGFRLRRQSV